MIPSLCNVSQYVDGLVQERRNSIANALELLLSCTNPSIDGVMQERRNSIANALELRLSCTKPSISYRCLPWLERCWCQSCCVQSPAVSHPSLDNSRPTLVSVPVGIVQTAVCCMGTGRRSIRLTRSLRH